jgi:hypothetical protein
VLLDAELQQRVDSVQATVEQHRLTLQQRAADAKTAAAAAVVAEAEAAAAAAAAGAHGRPRNYNGAGAGGFSGSGGRFNAEGLLQQRRGEGSGGSKWGRVSQVVELNMNGWKRNEKSAQRWLGVGQPGGKPLKWEDVIFMGDLYIKRRAGNGGAVYEARCRDLGVTPCNQVGDGCGQQLRQICQSRRLPGKSVASLGSEVSYLHGKTTSSQSD